MDMREIKQQDRMLNSISANALTCVRNDVMLFSELGFTLTGGEILQIQGANGSGKTSLLRILCGLAIPDAGEVLWNGKNIHDQRQNYFTEMSYIGHINGIKTELTALENLAVAAALAAANHDISHQEILAKVGLAGYENSPAQKLSSGQRRRLALARLLISDTRLWILDEPLTALDDYGRQLMKDMISSHAAGNGITVLATHDPVDITRNKITMINL
jgi:heme exporter protein A